MTRLVVASINAQGVTDPAQAVLDSVRTPLAGVAIAGLQEVAPLRGPHQLRLALSGKTVGVHHDTRTGARAGSAVVWDKSRVTARGRGMALLARAEPGDAMRDRYAAWVQLDLQGDDNRGISLLFVSCHRPLRSTGDQPEFDGALAGFLRNAPVPWIVAGDWNTPRLPPVLDRLGSWKRAGIDGFLLSPGLNSGRAFRLPATRSDHRPIALEVRW